MSQPRTAFYCVSNSVFFLGAVALINSLRVAGHDEPVFVLDCGLTEPERALLSREATLVDGRGAGAPWLLKTLAPLRHPADVMVLVDADIVITRPFDELMARASGGRVLAVEHGSDRFFPEWEELGLGEPRRQPYVSSSLVVLGGDAGQPVLEAMHRAQPRAGLGDSPFSGERPGEGLSVNVHTEAIDNPFFFPDQDVLNAVLATRLERERLEVLDRRLEAIPPFEGLRVVDETTLRCSYDDGVEPFAVHHVATKPWLEWTPPGVYTRLLLRALLRRDVPMRLRVSDLPPHLRPGLQGRAANLLDRLRGRRPAGER